MENLAKYKETLLTIKEKIEGDLKELGVHNPQVKSDWVATPEEAVGDEADSNVAADQVENWEERRATLATLETEYNNVVAALQKMEDGQFGKCEVCNEAIETDRLTVNPAARTCKSHMNDETMLS